MEHSIIAAERRQKVLYLDELCEYLGWAKSYVYKKVADGTIPASNPTGKKLCFDRPKIDEFLLGTQRTGREKLEVDAATYLATKK